MPETEDLTPEEEAYFETRGAEAPAEQPVVEPVAEPVAEEKRPEPRLVPLEALHEERRERQALAKQVQEREQAFTRLQTRLDTLEELRKPVVEPPTYEEDPLGAINHKLEETTKNYETLQRAEQARAEQTAREQQIAKLQSFGKAQADEYVKKVPDFYDAYNAMQSLKEAELRAMGYTDDGQIREWVLEYEFNMIQKAANEGANIADRLYTMAKALGYTPKQTADAEKKLDAIAAGQQASKSLGGAGGAAPAAKLTLEALDKMSDDEFAKYTSDPDVWRKLNTGA